MTVRVLAGAALFMALAGAVGAATFAVATHIAPGERPRDPRITHGRFGW
jgi:hypothetical protein